MIHSVPILHESRSLKLRCTVSNDATLLFHQGFSQREFMRLFRLNDRPTCVADVHQALVNRQQIPPDQERYLELLILHRRYGPIGLCALADYAPLHRRAEYLIGLFDTSRRQVGYGLEVTLMMMDLAFNVYNLHKLYAATYAYNQPAQKGLMSVGFQQEGHRRDHVFDQISQHYVDLYDYGLTITDFRENSRLVPLSQRLLGRDITQTGLPPLSEPDITRASQSGCRILQTV